MSRGAIVSATAMLAFLLYRLRARWLMVVAMIFLLGIAATLPDRYYRRMGAMLSGEDDTGSGRTEIWMTGIQSLAEFGVIGAGLNNFTAVYRRYVPGTGIASHNMYLMVSVELGIPGLALMLAGLASALLAVRKARSEGHGGIVLGAIEAAYVGILTSAMLGDLLWSKTIWLALTLLIWSAYPEQQSDHVPDASASRG